MGEFKVSQQQKKKKTTKLVALSLVIYIVIFGGIYLFMSGNMKDMISAFKPSEKVPVVENQKEEEPKHEDELKNEEEPENEEKPKHEDVKDLKQMQAQVEDQISMDESKSDALLVEEMKYLQSKFFKDEKQTKYNDEADDLLLPWMALKLENIEDPDMKVEANEYYMAIMSLHIFMKQVDRYQSDESLLDYVDERKIKSFEDELEYLEKLNKGYAKMAEEELKKLKKLLDE